MVTILNSMFFYKVSVEKAQFEELIDVSLSRLAEIRTQQIIF